MTSLERMLKRMQDELASHGVTLPDDSEIRRTYAGAVQRSQGAWSWFMHSPSSSRFTPWNVHDIGSNYPVHVLLKCKKWRILLPRRENGTNALYVDPCDECITRFGRVRF